MKILHVINSLSIGGAEKLVSTLCPLQINQELDSHVLVLRKDKTSFYKYLKNKSVPVLWTGIQNLYSPMQVLKLRQEIEKYDIVHVHLFPAQYWVILASFLLKKRIKIITTEHNTSNRRRRHTWFKYIEKFIYSRYNRIICISKATKDALMNWIPSLNEKLEVVNNGIDLEVFHSARSIDRSLIIPKADSEMKVGVMVARLSEQKDHETVIKAMQYWPNNYYMLFVGDGPRKQELVNMVSALNLQNRVLFLGNRNDVPQILKSSDFFVLSSNWEGFGLVAVEAMAAGIPVFASDVPGLRDVVGTAGQLFLPKNSKQLAKQVQDTMENTKIRNQAICNGLERAKKYSLESMALRYAEIYRSIC